MKSLASHQRAPARSIALDRGKVVVELGRAILAGDRLSDLAVGLLVGFLKLVVRHEPGWLRRRVRFGPADPCFADHAAEGVAVERGVA